MRLIIAAAVVALASCKAPTTAQHKTAAQPAVLVYKTKADYNHFVPVILSDDKSSIVSYPAPSDLMVGDKYSKPTLLHDGYLLDNRGIGKNSAFVRLTYDEYAAMGTAPSLEELYNLIIDKNPLTELYDCGTSMTEAELNSLIDSKQLKKKCKKIK
ncbi:hypothetical protein [Polluticoccus soli]|uniref:hypothetical protein n=1 Tax=Polluticoccus soli TaxID=3034150 RepID=UPI0023E12CE1|nr:hypothetical protein [Flavipsychrobacter sp. JY13-12]